MPQSRLDAAWSEPVQRERALQSLLDDGLVVEKDGRFALPELTAARWLGAPPCAAGGRRSPALA